MEMERELGREGGGPTLVVVRNPKRRRGSGGGEGCAGDGDYHGGGGGYADDKSQQVSPAALRLQPAPQFISVPQSPHQGSTPPSDGSNRHYSLSPRQPQQHTLLLMPPATPPLGHTSTTSHSTCIPPRSVVVHDREVLGKGSFGTVYLCDYLGAPAAIKVLRPQTNREPNEEYQKRLALVTKEIEFAGRLMHKNIISFYGTHVDDKGRFGIVMERGYRTLSVLLKDHAKDLSIYQRFMLAYDVTSGLACLHNRVPPIIHRDLKLDNIMVQEIAYGYHAKICDFGISVEVPFGSSPLDHAGTLLYMAPEVMKRQQYNEKADIYSLGLCIYQIITGLPIYEDLRNHIYPCHICRVPSTPNTPTKERCYCYFKHAVAVEGVRPPLDFAASVTTGADPYPALAKGSQCGLRKLLVKCWDANPANRLDCGQVLVRLRKAMLRQTFSLSNWRARMFWGQAFLKVGFERDAISWEVFEAQFFMAIGHNANSKSPKFAIRKQILEELLRGKDGRVHIESFSRFVNRFGPMEACTTYNCNEIDDDDESCYVDTHNSNTYSTTKPCIMRTMQAIAHCGWFYGDLDVNGAGKLLKGTAPGTFLLRFSSSGSDISQPGAQYSISISTTPTLANSMRNFSRRIEREIPQTVDPELSKKKSGGTQPSIPQSGGTQPSIPQSGGTPTWRLILSDSDTKSLSDRVEFLSRLTQKYKSLSSLILGIKPVYELLEPLLKEKDILSPYETESEAVASGRSPSNNIQHTAARQQENAMQEEEEEDSTNMRL
eukprot:TRINITY_DN2158_c0_g2_i2.p1 TRINITY_DN2158_c0_g2~~TRINITY_DN2158_c0_g2_i2.p1  ORF type:complete len:771 (-),score=94.11 TRINITY_DN2158_c0_g2_i2:58-2370(-)